MLIENRSPITYLLGEPDKHEELKLLKITEILKYWEKWTHNIMRVHHTWSCGSSQNPKKISNLLTKDKNYYTFNWSNYYKFFVSFYHNHKFLGNWRHSWTLVTQMRTKWKSLPIYASIKHSVKCMVDVDFWTGCKWVILRSLNAVPSTPYQSIFNWLVGFTN